ncbi:iron complex outermembrane receptor protein [Sphingorhabdus rigui]|uniref:Iron complex outermembrane receptor protein n=1 Tax=Sphingorhabdus rigui TaxID=1282858 RepID=A0A840B6B9_9SPHN|nr:TonB-dependent receptor [Sphingorhabdus rigui]MBB3943685.1 iron complex outermembrane receptor protein [Sphingorhabdus rigui]
MSHFKSVSSAWLACGTAAVALMAAQPALAQDSEDTTTAATGEEKSIVVIGSRRTDRSDTASSSPVDVIGSDELQGQPQANLLDVVRNLVPSFYVPQNTISDASTFVRAPSLRGLGADQILVMINGKRYNRSALVQVYTGGDTALSFGSQGADVSNIPAIALKNLQVLRDGATAQYGSDAIAGVINYQLRDDAGFDVQALWGQQYEGDGTRKQMSANAGFKLGSSGFVNISGEWFDSEGTSRGATRPIALELARTQPGVVGSIPNLSSGLPAQIWGSSPSDGYKLFMNSALDVGDNAQLYLVANYAHSKANQSFNYRSPISAPVPLTVDIGTGTPATRSPGRNGSFNTIYLTPCPAGNATCPAGSFVFSNLANTQQTFNFSSIYPGGFTPRFIGKVDQFYSVAGVKGEAESGLTYDVSATLARNSLSLSMTDSLSASYGPQSQTEFFFGKLIQREQNVNLDLTYPLEVGFFSPVTLSGGAEYRREEYETTVGDLQSYGAGPFAVQDLYRETAPGVYAFNSRVTQSPAASGYGGVSPTFAGTNSQQSYAVYVGAETDVTEQFTAGVAGRWEHYDTFGSTVVGKLNARYDFSDAVAVRFTAGTGFHAPSPGQNNTQIVTTNFRSGNQVQTGTYPVTSDIAQYYGATSLNPEKSLNFGGGIVLTPMDKLSITLDGYSVKVKNRIGISQTFTVSAADLVALPSLAVVGLAGDVNYFTNGFETRTTGFDFVTNYRTDLAGGPLSLTLAYNYNKSKVTDFDPLVISPAQRFNVSNLPPKHRVNASANWQIGDFSINARENYFSSWANQLEYPGQKFGAKFVTDLDISYTFADRYTLTVGANNLFDTYPDKIAPTATNPVYALTNSLADGQVYPRSGGPFGINGGFYYVRVAIDY